MPESRRSRTPKPVHKVGTIRKVLMKLLIFSLLVALSCAAQTETITFTNRQGRVYENVRLKNYDQESLLWFQADGAGGGKIKFADLPDYLQRQYGVDPVQLAQRDFEKAVAAGSFRQVDGIIYDLRKPQPGWTSFRNVKLIQAFQEENAVLIDPQPDVLSIEAVHVKNLMVLSDTERFSFKAMLVGNYAYINKRGNQRVVRSYDAGRACTTAEIPDELRTGIASSAPSTSLGRLGSLTTDSEIDPTTGLPRPQMRRPVETGGQPFASGTGFFITEDGYLVTSDHVARGASRIRIQIRSQMFDAKLVRSSTAFDLALLKVSGKFTPLPLDFDRSVTLGDPVFTIGFPNTQLQGSEPKYTDGKVSSLSGAQDDPSQYQVSVPIQPGNSGGPLVAENGAVVGVLRSKLNDIASLMTSGSIPQNVNYAVKIKYLKDLLEPIPGLMQAVKPPQPGRKAPDAVKTAQEATALVLVY